MYQVRIHVAHPLLLFFLPFWFRSCLSWHYPNSPKNRKNALSPRHDWLHGRSEQKKDPLRIWFYPQ
ncbi:serine/threonine protein kinase [Salmonella enterica subsp. enterica serovar Gaminara]|nr:serine/threonine protein kinase [Salmonella enterica subsp. enterica serovar Gaminara]